MSWDEPTRQAVVVARCRRNAASWFRVWRRHVLLHQSILFLPPLSRLQNVTPNNHEARKDHAKLESRKTKSKIKPHIRTAW